MTEVTYETDRSLYKINQSTGHKFVTSIYLI